MTDWTRPEDVPATTVERLHQWLNEGNPEDAATSGERAVADVIRAFWPAPAPTLAEELRGWAKTRLDDDPSYEELVDLHQDVEHFAARAEQIEQERDEARAEVERLTKSVIDNIPLPMPPGDIPGTALPIHRTRRSNPKETLAGSLPEPADVPSGEPWIVEVDGEQRTAVRGATYHRPWNTFKKTGSVTFAKDHEITLVSRFVPAPRVITDPEELDKLGDGSVVMTDGWSGFPWQRSDDRWYSAWAPSLVSEEVSLPVTVLWEAGE